jgi:hypothetical protein
MPKAIPADDTSDLAYLCAIADCGAVLGFDRSGNEEPYIGLPISSRTTDAGSSDFGREPSRQLGVTRPFS